jgi:ABC-type transporter Mla subunit MlaD
VPVLDAIDPQQFAAALHALAEGFVGNTDQLRRATVQGEQLLTGTERTLPNLERNLVHLQHFSAALHSSDTDLLRALNGLAEIGDVLRTHPQDFDATIQNLVPLATNLGDVLTARQTDLGDLAGKGRAVLDQVAARTDDLAKLAPALDGFLGVWVADLSEGPNWRILVTTSPASGQAYAAGQEPHPEPGRTAAMRRIAPDGSPARGIADILLAPLPTQDLPTPPPLSRPLPVVSLL